VNLLELKGINQNEIYCSLISYWGNASKVVLGGHNINTGTGIPLEFSHLDSFLDQMMLADMTGYLPNDILTKVDRAGMAASLETRIPLLDHAIVEHALRMPLAQKIHNGQGKWPLRKILYKHVPRELIERPKMGFGVPINTWLKGALRSWCEGLLEEKRLREEGFFDPEAIRLLLNKHMSGNSDESTRLWPVLMFQAWQDQYRHQWSQQKLAVKKYV
jgi:asparagine synthase (glutamine-hydrolysing)